MTYHELTNVYSTLGQVQRHLHAIITAEKEAEKPDQAVLQLAKGSRTMLRRLEKQLKRRDRQAEKGI